MGEKRHNLRPTRPARCRSLRNRTRARGDLGGPVG
nr:MAG TPA: hypothetical protein [Caudoviricetes sp.]